jgi:hypothetical protein
MIFNRRLKEIFPCDQVGKIFHGVNFRAPLVTTAIAIGRAQDWYSQDGRHPVLIRDIYPDWTKEEKDIPHVPMKTLANEMLALVL